jgi:hypothetical protein
MKGKTMTTKKKSGEKRVKGGKTSNRTEARLESAISDIHAALADPELIVTNHEIHLSGGKNAS